MSFKTPDGKEFKTKKEWKKHYRSLLKFEKVENKNDLVRKPGVRLHAIQICPHAHINTHTHEQTDCERKSIRSVQVKKMYRNGSRSYC